MWCMVCERLTGCAFWPSRRFAAARTRTWDHLVNSEALYQLSYGGTTHYGVWRRPG